MFPNIVNQLFTVHLIASSLIIILSYVLQRRISKTVLLVTLMYGVFFFSSVINYGNTDIQKVCTTLVGNIALVMYFDMGIRYSPLNFLRGIKFFTVYAVFMSAFTMFFHINGSGWSDQYFFGQDNFAFFPLFVLLIFCIVGSYINEGKISPNVKAFIIVTTAAYIYTWSVSGAVGLILLIGYLVFFCRKNINIVNANVCFAAMIIIFFGIVIFRWYYLFGDFIVNVLHKDLTLTGRTYIWDRALNQIKNSFWLGYGWEKAAITEMKIIKDHAHNMFLDILYRGGIMALIPYALLLNFCRRQLIKFKTSRIANLLGFSLLCYFIVSSFDFYFFQYIVMGLYVMIEHIDILESLYSKNKENADCNEFNKHYSPRLQR